MSKIIGLQGNGVRSNIVGAMPSETASIAYTGELLPAGSLPDVTKRYLKNSGKDKTPALVESGQGKFFNGTNQYIDTGIIPNQAQGTLVTRFTYVTGQVSRCIIGNTEISIWVNASGKIEGLFGNAVITSTDVLVNALSYHVSLSWSGLVATLKVNYVTKASGTATAFNPTLPMAIGARLTAITPTLDRYFNNVIDETYYYDVALSDSQIEALYKYPEKVKSYNGAIVPDIGSEDNCKLFLPMCENSGSNVVNVAVATPITELCGDSQMDANGWWTLSGGGISFSGGVLTFNATADYNGVQRYNDSNLSINKIFYCEIDIVSITSNTECGIRDGNLFTPFSNLGVQNRVGKQQFIFKSGGLDFRLYGKIGNPWSCTSLTIKEITNKCYPLASYTTAMHTSAAKLSYGAQCTAWNRDSLGVLLGMSNGLSTDGAISIKAPATSYTPLLTDDFAFAYSVLANGVSRESFGSTTGTVLSKVNATNAVSNWVFGIASITSILAAGYHRVAVKYNGTTKRYSVYIDGVLSITSASDATTSTGTAIVLFRYDNQPQAYARIWKPLQIAKFDPVKDYQASLKYVAKLGE